MTNSNEAPALAERLKPAEWKLETRTIPLDEKITLMDDHVILLDAERFQQWVKAKLLKADSPQGVEIAIELTYGKETEPAIDIEVFCEKWGMDEIEFRKSLAVLQKKGRLQHQEKVVQLSLFPLGGQGDE